MRSFVPLMIALGASLAAPATAGSRIVTPALTPPTGGALLCNVVNASTKRELVAEIVIYDTGGVAVCTAPQVPVTIDPGASVGLGCGDANARYCSVSVVKGGSKNAIVSLSARDSSNNIRAAVPAGR